MKNQFSISQRQRSLGFPADVSGPVAFLDPLFNPFAIYRMAWWGCSTPISTHFQWQRDIPGALDGNCLTGATDLARSSKSRGCSLSCSPSFLPASMPTFSAEHDGDIRPNKPVGGCKPRTCDLPQVLQLTVSALAARYAATIQRLQLSNSCNHLQTSRSWSASLHLKSHALPAKGGGNHLRKQ